MTLNQAAESYLGLLELSARLSHSSNESTAREAQTVWRGLREARVYDVPNSVQDVASKVVHELLADPGARMPDMELPFNALFVGCKVDLTAKMLLTPEQYPVFFGHAFTGYNTAYMPVNITLSGYLLPPDGECWAFIYNTYADGAVTVLPVPIRRPTGTEPGVSNMYYVLAVMARAITHHTTQVLKDMPEFGKAMRQRKKFLGMAKVALPVPPPFYEIVVKDVDLHSVMREGTRVSDPRTGWELTHQVEVAGHVKYKIMRGDLPVRPERLVWLAKNKYQLFQGSMQGAPQEILDGLQRRGVWHPDSNEWLAVKVSHVKPYCKGPETGVIVPAVRVVR